MEAWLRAKMWPHWWADAKRARSKQNAASMHWLLGRLPESDGYWEMEAGVGYVDYRVAPSSRDHWPIWSAPQTRRMGGVAVVVCVARLGAPIVVR